MELTKFHKHTTRENEAEIVRNSTWFKIGPNCLIVFASLGTQNQRSKAQLKLKQKTESLGPLLRERGRRARDRSRFFDQVGHQKTNASIENEHFFTKIMNNLVKDLKILSFKVILQCLKAYVSAQILIWHSLRHSHSADF